MASNNEAKIKFSADTSEFNSAIKEAKDETKQLNAEMRLNEATFKNTGDAAEYLSTKHDLLSQKLEANQKQQEALNEKIELAKEYYGEDSDEVQKLEMQLTNAETAEQKLITQIDDTNAALSEQVSEAEESGSALDTLTQTIADQESELATLKDEYTNAVLEFGSTSDEAQTLAGEIENLSTELQANKDTLADAQGSADQFDKSMGNLSESGLNVGSVVPGAFGNIADSILSGGIAGLVAGITDNIGDLIQAAWDMANEWQESQGSIATGTGLVEDELDNLTEKAYEAAGALADVDFDGSASADVIAELNTRLGLTGDQAAEVTAEVGKFAKANGEDAVPAVDTLVNMMHRWGLEAEDMPHLLDQLTVAQQATQYSASDMADAVEKNAPSFKALGFSMDESLSYMMAFADYSDTTYQSAMAGTKKAVTNLSSATDDVPGAFQEAISVMQSGADMSTILSTEIGDTGKTIQDVFGKKSAQDMVDFFQNSGTGIDDYVAALQDCDGAMQTTYDNTVTWKDQNAQTMNAIKGQVFGAVFGSDGIINSVTSMDTSTESANSNMSMSFVDFGNTAGSTAGSVSAAASDMDTSVSNMSSSVKSSASDAASSVSGSFSGMNQDSSKNFESMKSAIGQKASTLKGSLSTFATDAKTKVTGGFSDMKTNASQKFEQFKTTVGQKASSMKGTLSSFASDAKTKVTGGFADMKSGASSRIEEMRSAVQSKTDTIRSTLSNWSGAKSSLSSAFSDMKSNASSRLSDMKSSVSDALSSIKSKFGSLKLKLPRPSLPSFSLKTSSKTILGKTFTYPTGFSVSWNAEGVIFNRPTIFATRAGYQGVGEAGPEAVAPISKLQDYVAEAVGDAMCIDYDLLGAKVAQACASMNITIDVNNRELGRVVRGLT